MHWPKDLTELLSSFVIVFGYLMIYTVVKQKALGLDTKSKQMTFAAVGIMGFVFVGTMVGMAWTSAHAWANPTYAIEQWMAAGITPGAKGTSEATILYGVQAASFMVIGSIVAGVAFVMAIMLYNAWTKGTKIKLEQVFNYRVSNKIQADILVAFIIGALGTLSLAMVSSDLTGDAKSFFRPLVSGMICAGLIIALGLEGPSYFNPCFWIGAIIAKFYSQRKITVKNLIDEACLPLFAVIGGFTAGWCAFGISKLPA